MGRWGLLHFASRGPLTAALDELLHCGVAACKQMSTTPSSLSLVRFDNNDYSVPVRWAHHPVVAKGDWQEVRIYAQGQQAAQHGRIWEKEPVRFEPLH